MRRRDAIVANRARVGAFLPSPPVWLEQVHGNDGRVDRCSDNVDAARARAPIADAAVTRLVDVPLAVRVADCLPVLLADDAGTVVAVSARGMARACCGRARSDGRRDAGRRRHRCSRGSGRRSDRARSRSATTFAMRSPASDRRRRSALRSRAPTANGWPTCPRWRAAGSPRSDVTRVSGGDCSARGATRRDSSRTGAIAPPRAWPPSRGSAPSRRPLESAATDDRPRLHDRRIARRRRARRRRRRGSRSRLHASWIPRLVSFAVGALLGAVFLELLPHALEAGSSERVMATVLVGLLALLPAREARAVAAQPRPRCPSRRCGGDRARACAARACRARSRPDAD